MTVLGISLIVAGFALVCAGLFTRPSASQTERTNWDQPGEFRPVLDALDEEDRRQPEEKVHDSKNGLPNAWEELNKLSGD
jgi:hypothetical protein